MSQTLADARTLVAALDDALKGHKLSCIRCGDKRKGRRMCDEGRDLAAELADARKAVKTWFDPGPDQGTLL